MRYSHPQLSRKIMDNKKNSKSQFSRRTFLQHSSLVAAGTVAAAISQSQAAASESPTQPIDTSKILNYNPKMNYRRLGKTNLMISEISLGGHWANKDGGRMWVNFAHDEIPAEVIKDRTAIVSRCIDKGVNYVDITNSAECLVVGAALKGRREKMYLAASDSELSLHNPDFCNAKSQMNDIESCLRRLKTDYLDIWRAQFRHDGKHPDSHIEAVVETFEKAKAQGKVRFLGMSTHTRSFVEHIIDAFPAFSMVIFPYMAKSKVKPADIQSIDPAQIIERGSRLGSQGASAAEHAQKSIFDTVKEKDIGVVTIKPFGGGSLFRTHPKFGQENSSSESDYERARLTLAYILCNSGISATVPGMSTLAEIDNNVRAASERLALLDQNGIWKLCDATNQMWDNLPQEYRWLNNWEWV